VTKTTLIERMAATAASARINMKYLTDKQIREVERLAEQIQSSAMTVRIERHVAASMGIPDPNLPMSAVLDRTGTNDGDTETIPAVTSGELP